MSNVSQMHRARQGEITPEMEFIATRENQKIVFGLERQHPGQSFGAHLPKLITAQFVRDAVARGREPHTAMLSIRRTPPMRAAASTRAGRSSVFMGASVSASRTLR